MISSSVAPAQAADTGKALAAVGRIHSIVISASKASGNQKIALITATLDRYMDIERLAAKVTGQAWQQATAAERNDFKRVLRDVFALELARRIKPNDGFSVTGAKTLSDGGVVVLSRLGRPGETEKRLDWKMHPCGSTYCIYDLVSNGASLSVARRDDYAPRLQSANGSLAALTRSLRAELDAKQ